MGWYFVNKADWPEGEKCEICQKPLEAGRKFYMHESHNDPSLKNPKVTHAACEWEQEEKRQKAIQS